MEPILLTQSGIEELQIQVARLEEMLKSRRASVERAVQNFGLGDEQYYDRIEVKNETLAELNRYKAILKQAKIVEEVVVHSTDSAVVGSKVNLVSPDISYDIQLVSSIEANPLKNKISIDSPLGQAVAGKRVGDIVEVVTPVGKATFKIESIA